MNFVSTNKLDFEACSWHINPSMVAYRVGTCKGIYYSNETSYNIVAIINETPNNGHLNDVLEWFEQSCRRDKKSLCIVEIWNKKFQAHLIKKRGFVYIGNGCVEKKFDSILQ